MPQDPGAALRTSHQQLLTLRALLRRDYLTRPDWSAALADLAQMTHDALAARQTLVALYDPSAERWTAYSSTGAALPDAGIPAQASRSVLERVRLTGKALLATAGQPLELTSDSLVQHRVETVLAAPLSWFDLCDGAPRRAFAGCLYAHRSAADLPFTEADVELALDITQIAERTLNVLRRLQGVSAELAASHEELRGWREAAASRYRLGGYASRDRRFAETVLVPLGRLARAPKVGLLLLGPTGSGKSHLAQAYHYESSRREGPFVVLDCSQVTSEETLAAELFGYAPRSGFANAPPEGRPGAAQRAHRGTLFIDEIACLPLPLQQRLLTLIQTGSFSPIGTSQRVQCDLQVVAATHADLERLVRDGRFREDLFWRISEVVLRLPPLSERAADVPALAEAFFTEAQRRFDRPELAGFAPEALRALQRHDWSRAGNIRGLEHLVNRSVLLAPPGATRLEAAHLELQSLGGPGSTAAELPAEARPEAPPVEVIKTAIRRHGSGTDAARSLGITRGVLIWQLRKHGLTVGDVLAEESG